MSNKSPLLSDRDQLAEVFRSSETPRERWLIGMEAEKFGLQRDGSPLPYSGKVSVSSIFDGFEANGWRKRSEVPGGPVIWLERGSSNITLEPGGQLELSGAPAPDVHTVVTEMREHLQELDAASEAHGIHWLHVGFHPLARLEELPWVPKQRYPIMRAYLPTRGSRGLDMMQRTATVQVNLDYSSEKDAMSKLLVLLRATPFLQAMTVNAPFYEGGLSKLQSQRLDVWLNMDPQRSGLIAPLWDVEEPTYEDYVTWALQAGMFLVKRERGNLVNSGQSFLDFMKQGFEGERAHPEDWQLHLGTLFPEVRLKKTIEVRCFDALPPDLAPAVPALLVGLVYDEQSLYAARELLAPLDYASAVKLQREVAQLGLGARWAGRPIVDTVIQLLDLAEAGLERRARIGMASSNEAGYLQPLRSLAERGATPATELIERIKESELSPRDYFKSRA